MSGGVGAGARGGFNPLRGATTGVVMRRRATSGEMARGGLVFVFSLEVAPVSEGVGAGARGGFNPLRGATTGVVMRRRATSGEMARGGLVFVFSLEVAPVSEGDSFTPSGEDGTRGFDFLFWRTLLPFVLRVVAGACVGRRSGQPRMPPRERQHEELGGLGVSFRATCRLRRGRHPALRRGRRGGWGSGLRAAAGAAARGVKGIGVRGIGVGGIG